MSALRSTPSDARAHGKEDIPPNYIGCLCRINVLLFKVVNVDGDWEGCARLVDDAGLPAAHGQHYTLSGGAFFAINQGGIARITHYRNQREFSAQVAHAAS